MPQTISQNQDIEFWRDRVRRNFINGDRALFIGRHGSIPAKAMGEAFGEVEQIEVSQKSVPDDVVGQIVGKDFDLVFVEVESNVSVWMKAIVKKMKSRGRLWAHIPRSAWEEMLLTPVERKTPDFDKSVESERADLFLARFGLCHVAFGVEGLVFGDWLNVNLPKVDGTRVELFAYRADQPGRFESIAWQHLREPFCDLFYRPPQGPDEFVRRAELIRARRRYHPIVENEVLLNSSRGLFPQRELQRYEKWLQRRPHFLTDLVRKVCEGLSSDSDRLLKIYSFVQDSVVRDTVVQPLNRDGTLPRAAVTLLAQTGRCGHVAALLVEMLTIAGIRAKIWQWRRHVSVKVSLAGNEWFLLDPDIFKFGVVPMFDGRFITTDQIFEHPEVLDTVPATGWFIDDLSRTRVPVRGYHEELPIDVRGYVSTYFSSPEASSSVNKPCPFVPSIAVSSEFGKLRLQWSDHGKSQRGFLHFEIRLSHRSRGWNYRNLRENKKFPNRGSGDIAILNSSVGDISIQAPASGPMFAEVATVTSWLSRESRTYFWPSEEVEIKI